MVQQRRRRPSSGEQLMALELCKGCPNLYLYKLVVKLYMAVTRQASLILSHSLQWSSLRFGGVGCLRIRASFVQPATRP